MDGDGDTVAPSLHQNTNIMPRILSETQSMMQLCLSDHALVSLSTNYPNFLVSEIGMSVHVVIGSDIKKSSL